MEDERRRYPRYRTEFTVAIEPMDKAYAHFRDVAQLHDISNGGLSFLSGLTDIYAPHQRLKATILPPEDAADSSAIVQAYATIVWVKSLLPDAEGVQIGVSLDEWIDAREFAV